MSEIEILESYDPTRSQVRNLYGKIGRREKIEIYCRYAYTVGFNIEGGFREGLRV